MRTFCLFLIALAAAGVVDAVNDVAKAITAQTAACSAPSVVPLADESVW